MTKYIQNEEGGVQSVSDEHFENVLHEDSEGGRRYLKHGFRELTEAEARDRLPQLFGKADPQVVYRPDELKAQLEKQRSEAEFYGYTPQIGAEA